jgi:hypothetical protein
MYAKSYIDQLVGSEPSWETCVALGNITKHEEIQNMMGALASAVRSGSEITHLDWGEEWIDHSDKYLEEANPIRKLASAGKYSQLDDWLLMNEDRILCMIHQKFTRIIQEADQQI